MGLCFRYVHGADIRFVFKVLETTLSLKHRRLWYGSCADGTRQDISVTFYTCFSLFFVRSDWSLTFSHNKYSLVHFLPHFATHSSLKLIQCRLSIITEKEKNSQPLLLLRNTHLILESITCPLIRYISSSLRRKGTCLWIVQCILPIPQELIPNQRKKKEFTAFSCFCRRVCLIA